MLHYLEPLIALLKDRDSDVRAQVAKSLGQLDVKQAIKPLIALLKDRHNPNARKEAAKSLGQLGAKKQAIETLMILLKEQDSDVRMLAAESLGLLGVKKAIAPLIALVKNQEEPLLRIIALFSLGQLGAKQAIEPLMVLLKDHQDSFVQRVTAQSLGQLGIEKAIEPLMVLLNKENLDVQVQIAESLAQFGAKEAIEPLIALIAFLKQGVQKSLELEFLKNSVFLTKDSQDSLESLNNSEILFNTLDKSHSEEPKQDIQQLFDSLEDDNVHTQKQAIESLGKIAATVSKELQAKILDKLTAIASNPQELFGTRIKALKNLGKLGTEAAAKRVIQIATEESGEYKESYRFAAYQALQDTDSPVALDFLKQELKQLAQQKQQWRKQRDHDGKDLLGFENLEGLSNTADCNTATVVENEKRWRYGHWETELGYAIAQHDPEIAGLKLLAHPLANVRKGAWFGIAKIGVPTVEIIRKIHAEREKSQEAYFRHAAFRAIDKSLITIEVFGKDTDLVALKNWLPDINDHAVRDRVKFTIAELEYRLSTTKE